MTRQGVGASGVLLLSAWMTWAEPAPEVQRILNEVEKAKPTPRQLAFYSLDWASDLKTAKERARREKRPIFLIGVMNITAGCNFYSGHT